MAEFEPCVRLELKSEKKKKKKKKTMSIHAREIHFTAADSSRRPRCETKHTHIYRQGGGARERSGGGGGGQRGERGRKGAEVGRGLWDWDWGTLERGERARVWWAYISGEAKF